MFDLLFIIILFIYLVVWLFGCVVVWLFGMFGCVSLSFCCLGKYRTMLGLCIENVLMQKHFGFIFCCSRISSSDLLGWVIVTTAKSIVISRIWGAFGPVW